MPVWVVPLAAWRQSHGEQGGDASESTRVSKESRENIGAGLMGRNMFGPSTVLPGRRAVDGLVGCNPPYHYPVFVLTHHSRDRVEMKGGMTLRFVTGGIESALGQANKPASGKDVMVWGCGRVAQQYLAAGLLDELELRVVPVLLGGGSRLLDGKAAKVTGPETLEQWAVCTGGLEWPARVEGGAFTAP
ncbi:MAG TPA: dihydrofolate reductase family protein [Streptosporangiaceae bacterium]